MKTKEQILEMRKRIKGELKVYEREIKGVNRHLAYFKMTKSLIDISKGQLDAIEEILN